MTRAVAQRVRRAAVRVDGEVVGAIEQGLMILIGIGHQDTEQSVARVADKLAVLRVFEDEDGKMNLSAMDVGGAMLVVSQFTLYADLRRGRRPSYATAANPERGEALYSSFCTRLEKQGYRVERGKFGAHMIVELENDGPVTLFVDSESL